MTQDELGGRYSGGLVSLIEKGESAPSLWVLHNIADRLGVPVWALLLDDAPDLRLTAALADPRGFGVWLRDQIDGSGLSQRDLGTVAGVDHSAISRVINGNRDPLLGTALKLARACIEGVR
jgi:transcriptional regulator with XRE-family HTH domain